MKSVGLIRPIWWVIPALLLPVAGFATGLWQLVGLMGVALVAFIIADLLWVRLHWILGLLVVCVPLSIKIPLGGSGAVLSLPAEALVFVLAGVFLFYPVVSARLVGLPLTILLILQLVWMLVTTFASGDWMISGKRLVLHTVFFLVFYGLLAHAFRERKFVIPFYLLFALGMIIPVFNTWSQHMGLGFSPAGSFAVTGPFFDDHTIYGASLAFLLPAIGTFTFKGNIFQLSPIQRVGIGLLFAFLFLAFILSFSRAAWLSVLVAAVVFVLIRLRIPFWIWVMGVALISLVGYQYQDVFVQQFASTESVSHTEDVEAHALSVTNLQTDNSNLERINRWKCALRMAEAKPILGWGPGMYQFEYGQFQIRPEMTYLSTFRGEKGNAHSEYLTALSETGWPGLLLLLLIVGATYSLGLRLAYYAHDERERWIAIIALLGLTTFFIHGVVNTFWDQVQMAILVFGSMAILAGRYVSIKEQT